MADDGVNPELEHRTAAVRAAKIRKGRLGRGTDLDPDELDAVLPPIDCYRTRIRLARKAMTGPEPEGDPTDPYDDDRREEGDCPACLGEGVVYCECDGRCCGRCSGGERMCESCDGSGFLPRDDPDDDL